MKYIIEHARASEIIPIYVRESLVVHFATQGKKNEGLNEIATILKWDITFGDLFVAESWKTHGSYLCISIEVFLCEHNMHVFAK